MRVVVRGRPRGGGEEVEVRHELFDATDPDTGASSMARTTGYTATALAELVLAGRAGGPGVLPPERVGAEAGNLDFVLAWLEERRVRVRRCERPPRAP